MAPLYVLSAVGLVTLGLAAPAFAQTAGDKKPGAVAQPKGKASGATESEPSGAAKPGADGASDKSAEPEAKADDTSSPKAEDRSGPESLAGGQPTENDTKPGSAPAASSAPEAEGKVAGPANPETAGSDDFWMVHRPKPGEIELGYFLGLLSSSSRNNFHKQTLAPQDIGTGVIFGTRVGYFPFEFAGVELEAGITPTSASDGRAAQVWTLRGDVMAQLPLLRLVPFLVVGGGRMGVFSNTLGNDGDPLLHFGAGAKFALSDVVSARLDLRDNLTQKTNASDGSLTHGFELTLGITVRVPTQGAPTAEQTVMPPKDAQPEAPPPAKTDKPPPAMDPFDPEPAATPRPEPKPSPEPQTTPDASP